MFPIVEVLMENHECLTGEKNEAITVILAHVYSLILSWPTPNNETEPDANHLGRDAATGSVTRTPTEPLDACSF